MKTHKDFFEQYKEFEEAEAENRKRMLSDLEFGWSSDQWNKELRNSREHGSNGARPCLTINKLPTSARQIINNMRQGRASIKILPIDDRGDIRTAEMLQGLIRHIEHISNSQQAYSIASEFQVMMGLGYFRIDSDYTDPIYNEQELHINPIADPFAVRMDPWITDLTGADATAVYVDAMIPKAKFKREYPDATMESLSGSTNTWMTEKSVQITECFYAEDLPIKHVVIDGVARPLDDYDAERDGPYQSERTINTRSIKWKKLSGLEVLDERDEKGQYIPIIRVVGEDININGERMICGIVRRARDAQQMYNYTVSAMAERNALEPKAPWLVASEAVEGHESSYAAANRSNAPYLTYNAYDDQGQPLPPPQRQFPTGANSALLSQLQINDSDIQATTSLFAGNLGRDSNEKSGVALRQRQQIGDVGTYHYPDNMGRAIRQAGRVLVDLIPYYYDTYRSARILGDDGEAEHVQLDPQQKTSYHEDGQKKKSYNVGMGKYDVATSVGTSYATKRQEGAERMQAYLAANPNLWNVIGDFAMKLDDSPYAQEMSERIKRTIPPEITGGDEDGEPMDPEVAQQFQQMAQALQQQQAQMEQLGQVNQQLQQTVQGKVIEQQTKAADHQMKMTELEQQYAIKTMEFEQKQAELIAKQQESQMALTMTAEKNVAEYESIAELVQVASSGAESTQQILAALAQSTQQNSEILATMLQEMAKPKSLSVQTDSDGNVTGGISNTLQ